MTDEEIKRIINKFTDVNFEIVKVDDSKSGETTVIIKFNDVTEAENFVTTINLSSSSEKNFVISVGYNLGSVVSFSAMLYPFALLSFLLKL